MSVIGRMDKQVWEVLIEPIARRRERQAQELELEKPEAPRDEATQPEADEEETE